MCYAENGENQFHCIFGSDGICYMVHPSDPASALVALGASVRIVGSLGSRVVPMEEFYVSPGQDAQKDNYRNN